MTYSTPLRLLGLSLSLSLLSACDQNACTEIAVASVTLEVVDGQSDEPIDDAQITFTIDDGPQREPADSFDGRYSLAYEEEGTFDVTVSAPSYEQVERTYQVGLDNDGCHVAGVSDTVPLSPIE